MPKDAHREHTALAADHLVKSLQILARVVLPDERKHEQAPPPPAPTPIVLLPCSVAGVFFVLRLANGGGEGLV